MQIAAETEFLTALEQLEPPQHHLGRILSVARETLPKLRVDSQRETGCGGVEMLAEREISVCCPVCRVWGGSQRDVLRFVFVLESRNIKRKSNSSYFLVKSELLNTLGHAAFPWSYIPLPAAVEKILRRDLWMKHSCTLGCPFPEIPSVLGHQEV